jgi:hypothetical protein
VVLPFHDRIDHDGRADVRDDQEQLQEGSEEDPVIGAAVRDVADGIVQDRLERISAGIDVTIVIRYSSPKIRAIL